MCNFYSVYAIFAVYVQFTYVVVGHIPRTAGAQAARGSCPTLTYMANEFLVFWGTLVRYRVHKSLPLFFVQSKPRVTKAAFQVYLSTNL